MKKSKKRKVQLKPDLTKEVGTLANKIASALKAAKDSDELKGFGRETTGSLRAAGSRIVTAIQKAKKSDAMQDIKAQSQKMLDIGKSRTKKAVKDVENNLAVGLQHIGNELQNIAERLKKK